MEMVKTLLPVLRKRHMTIRKSKNIFYNSVQLGLELFVVVKPALLGVSLLLVINCTVYTVCGMDSCTY